MKGIVGEKFAKYKMSLKKGFDYLENKELFDKSVNL